MDIFSACFEEVNNYVRFAEQNGKSGDGAKTLSIKMNSYTTERTELNRFALALSFLVWPFNTSEPSYDACFFAVSAAKRLLQTVLDSTMARVTHYSCFGQSSKRRF
jgi:hypothetical protein